MSRPSGWDAIIVGAGLLRLLDERDVPGEVRKGISRMDLRGSQGRVLLLTTALPHYAGFGGELGPQHLNFTLLGGTIDAFERCWRAQARGELAEEYPLEVLIQSATDPGLAPAGHHTISVGIQHLPYELAAGTWDSRRDDLTKRALDSLFNYAPNLKGRVEQTWTITPLDLERTYGMAKGNIFHGAMTPAQLFDSRPYPGFGGARSPVPGLYLCGAGTHPGGAVIGASGYNAARMVLRDLNETRRDRPQRPRPRASGRRGMADRLTRTADQFTRTIERAAGLPSLRALRAWSVRQRWLRPLVRIATKTRE